ALVIRYADERGWVDDSWRQVVMLATATAAYSLATAFDGSGFIATFAGGMAFGAITRHRGLVVAYLSEQVSELFSAVTFVAFGAIGIGYAWPYFTAQTWLYALASLTMVRMLPVAISLLGTHSKAPTVGFLGWFGPRGLASIVFALSMLGRGLSSEESLFATVVLTVALSIVAHGVTAAPLAAAYGRWYRPLSETDVAESATAHQHRVRLRRA
ncbi:MAG: cation:proton antiporter, partial [Coriobacteriia bacterium]|nr:cation:proton antiporter [Coriobacteriia bacterium]